MVFVFLRLLNPSKSQVGSGTPFQRSPGSIFDRFLTDFGIFDILLLSAFDPFQQPLGLSDPFLTPS